MDALCVRVLKLYLIYIKNEKRAKKGEDGKKKRETVVFYKASRYDAVFLYL